ncbi:MAG: bacillithiol biosynthesis BshC [Acidobacteria bacterium]|nr:bacillithiol biosynthesis BshC [Acidobacteriota bacterium]MBV9477246.1 bacillithiol biosynthesis BshC [Acidobacteriota bacterium]
MTRVPLARYPGMNRFVLDWLGGDARFLPRRTPIAARRRDVAPALVDALRTSNAHWGLSVAEPLARWASQPTLTFVAGQQVGFAGGPLYTLAKLATLVKMKRDAEAHGTPATAFFWLATEDHDFDEVATLNVPVAALPRTKDVNRQRDLVCMRAARTAEPRAAVGSLPVPDPLIEQLLSLFGLPRPHWLRAGITFRDSFAELVAQLFGDEVILVDALLPELRRAGAPLFAQLHARNDEIQRALHERGEALAQAGYAEQVVARDGDVYTLLFDLDAHGNRVPAMPGQQPERTSTSALTRPLLQDSVLQPDVFIGGPAEVAYYAQISTLHELLDIAMPRIALRGHALVAPKRVARAIERYGLDAESLFRAPDALLAEREPEGVAKIRELASDAKRDLFARIDAIRELALPADHSLAGSIQRSVGHLDYHFNKLAERAIKGLVRKDRERYAATRELVATLFPDGHVQDRVVSWFAYWQEHGAQLVERMVEEIEPDADVFKVVEV